MRLCRLVIGSARAQVSASKKIILVAYIRLFFYFKCFEYKCLRDLESRCDGKLGGEAGLFIMRLEGGVPSCGVLSPKCESLELHN